MALRTCLNALRSTRVTPRCPRLSTGGQVTCSCSCVNRKYSVFEPDDLDVEKEVPDYSTLNIRVRGYDYTVLEGYTKYVHNLVDTFGLETNVWAVPAEVYDVVNFKRGTNVVTNKCTLSMYERTVQMEDVPSTLLPLLMEVMQQQLPEGVSFTVKEPDEEEEENRYVPDLEIRELQSQIDEIEKAKEERKKK